MNCCMCLNNLDTTKQLLICTTCFVVVDEECQLNSKTNACRHCITGTVSKLPKDNHLVYMIDFMNKSMLGFDTIKNIQKVGLKVKPGELVKLQAVNKKLAPLLEKYNGNVEYHLERMVEKYGVQYFQEMKVEADKGHVSETLYQKGSIKA